MVMEAPPSPQSVGREFVRQYYTLLNKAPTHLHRFYNQQSSFIHGGLDPPNRETSPVVGQKQIHQKIQQLNFRDCHAKITQVDSQATLGKGVVVQVTGELSNAGQPMRRFTQTFVLAAQSPKKYYVHNDIFRYQDEIISDEECDAENRSEPDEDVVNQDCQVLGDVQQISQPPMQYYASTTPMQPTIPNVPPHHQQPPPPPPHVLAAPPPPTLNGAVHPDEINLMQGPVPTHVVAAAAQPPPAPVTAQGQGIIPQPSMANIQPTVQPLTTIAASVATPAAVTGLDEQQQTVDTSVDDTLETNYSSDPQEQEQQEQQDLVSSEPAILSNEPKTYANLLKSGSNVPFNSPSLPPPLPPQTQARPVSPPLVSRDQSGGNRGQNNRGPRQNQSQPRGVSRQDSGRGAPGRTSFNEDDDRKRSQGNSHGDVNQLFLGNLPHTATEDELREIFIQFGAILDLRVHSKPPNKTAPPGGRIPPNYGFITYETQQGVNNCLAAKPIYYPKDDKAGTQLNVEEKKIKDRQSFGGGRTNNENRPRGGGDQGSRRGGGSGGNMNNPNRGGGGGSGIGGNPITGGGSVGSGSGGNTGITPNRTSSYNRNGGPPNRGPNNYNRR